MRVTGQFSKGYVVAPDTVLQDTNLSWKAKGIFMYLLDQAERQELFCETEIAKHSTDGLASLRSGLKELEQRGYLKRQRVRGEQGKFKENEWILFETPSEMWDDTLWKEVMRNESTEAI